MLISTSFVGIGNRITRSSAERRIGFGPPKKGVTVEEGASQRAFKQLRYLLVGELKIGADPDLALVFAGNPGLALLLHRHELDERLAVARDDDLIARQRTLDEPRQRCFAWCMLTISVTAISL